jgi:Tol biopolymer transport system component
MGVRIRDDSLWLFPLNKDEVKRAIRPNLSMYLPDIKEKPWATEPLDYDGFYGSQYMHHSDSLIFLWAGHYSGGGYQLYYWERQKDVVNKITEMKADIISAMFSFDDSEIAFIARPHSFYGASAIWLMNADGTNLRRITIKFDL